MRRSLLRRPRGRSAAPSEPAGGSDDGAVVPPRAARRPGARGRRVLLGAAGVLLAAGSVAGFSMTSAAFDERIAVMVAGRDVAQGEVLAEEDLQPALVVPGRVPHLVWSADAAGALAGLAAARPLAAGALVTGDLLAVPSAGAFGNLLEVHVPIDLSLAPHGLAPGELVLLVDPGVPPSAHDPGRARQVIEVLRADLLEGAALRIFAAPAQWVRWQTLTARLGGLPMAVPVPLGGNPDALAAELDAVWAAQHAQTATAASPLGPDWASGARPGVLETIVSVDTSLSPSGLAEGDMALLVDPGVPASRLDGGRPRSVLRAVRLDHYRDGLLGVRAKPAEWVWWRSLPQQFGNAPMLLRVPPGTDVDEISAELNASWRSEWEQQR